MGTLNALLNCAMMLTYAVAAVAMERAYVHAATLHLAAHGVTRTTNSAEVHVSHWVARAVANWRRRRQRGKGRDVRDSGCDGQGAEDVSEQKVTTSINDGQGSAAVTAATAATAAADSHAASAAGTARAEPACGGGPPCSAVRPLWSLALLLLLMALVPAELYFETGLGEVPRGTTTPAVRHNGVCVSPWTGHSAVGVAAAALLVQRLNWLDAVWTAVPVGASKAMIITERFAWPAGWRPAGDEDGEGGGPGGGAVLAADCSVVVGACEGDGCGSVVIHRTDGPFHTIVTGASMAGDTNGTFPAATDAVTSRYAMGDLTYDGATGVAFLFWEVSPPSDEAAAADAPPPAARGTSRVHVRGVEVVLNASEMDRVLHSDGTPWRLDPVAGRARTYAVALSTSGLRAADVAMAASIFRTSQMEQPGVRRSDVHARIERLPPLTPSDVLMAVFALKAEDGASTCAGTVGVYVPHGTVRAAAVIPFVAAVAVVMGVWAALAAATRGLTDLHVPHDAESWRSYALAAHGWGGPAGPDEEEGGGGGMAAPADAKATCGDAAGGGGGELTPAAVSPPCLSPPTESGCAGVASLATPPPLNRLDFTDGTGMAAVASPHRLAPTSTADGEFPSWASTVGSSRPSVRRLSDALGAGTGRGREGGRRVQVAPPGAAVPPGMVFLSP